MTTPIDIPEKNIKSLFFKDVRRLHEKKFKDSILPLSDEEKEIPFFNLLSGRDLGFDIEKRETNKVELVLPNQAVNTKDPAVNNTEFAYKNLRIVLENQLMVLYFIRQLTEIENNLLFLLVDKKNAATPNDINELLEVIKERLVLLRHPTNQDLYTKFGAFFTEYNTVLNYLKENRAWPKSQ